VAAGVAFRATPRRTLRLLAAFFPRLDWGAFAGAASAQDRPEPSIEEIRKQKQNPLSALRSLYLQNDYATIRGKSAASSRCSRCGRSASARTGDSSPTRSYPSFRRRRRHRGAFEPGVGKHSVQRLLPTEPDGRPPRLGLGPSIQLPTRTDPALGSNRVSVGPAAVVLRIGPVKCRRGRSELLVAGRLRRQQGQPVRPAIQC
jgi:hypothetical protein